MSDDWKERLEDLKRRLDKSENQPGYADRTKALREEVERLETQGG